MMDLSETSIRSTSTARDRNYLVMFVVVFLIASIPALVSAILLIKLRENYSAGQALAYLDANGGLYGSAIHNTEYRFKIELYRHYQPEIVALGSSRVLAFQGAYFTAPYVNLGRTITQLSQGEATVDRLLADRPPKVVLLGIDFWWLNPKVDMVDRDEEGGGGWFQASDLRKPFGWIWNGTVSIAQVKAVFAAPQMHVGALANLDNDGYDRFGARQQWGLLSGGVPSKDEKFWSKLERVANNQQDFQGAATIDPVRWAMLERIVTQLTGAGIRVVAFLPPVSRPVLDAMSRSGRYGYVDELRRRIATLNVPYFDATNPMDSDIDDCEMIDGTHMGAIAAGRLLSRAIAAAPDIEAYTIARNRLNALIGERTGHTGLEMSGAPKREVDFLRLGCKK